MKKLLFLILTVFVANTPNLNAMQKDTISPEYTFIKETVDRILRGENSISVLDTFKDEFKELGIHLAKANNNPDAAILKMFLSENHKYKKHVIDRLLLFNENARYLLKNEWESRIFEIAMKIKNGKGPQRLNGAHILDKKIKKHIELSNKNLTDIPDKEHKLLTFYIKRVSREIMMLIDVGFEPIQERLFIEYINFVYTT